LEKKELWRENKGIEFKRKKILYVPIGLNDGPMGILKDRKVFSIFWRNPNMRPKAISNGFPISQNES
jgi:hypothetical protein